MSNATNHSKPRIGGAGSKNAVEAVAYYYTVAQLAARWSLCERQVHRYIASGALAATRFGRSVRVSRAEVALFEAGCIDVKSSHVHSCHN